MKKKFIQILMLLIATVSMGSFVSCKDTSEDLYNELRTQTLSENASLKEALNAYNQKLNEQIALYQELLREVTAIKEVSIPGLTDELTRQFGLIVDLQTALEGKADQSEVDELKGLLELLKNQINGDEGILINLNNLIASDAAQDALIATLQAEIANLKTWKDKIDLWCNETNNNIADVMTWLNTLQTEMTKAQADIQAAMDKAVQAQVDATAAKQMADLAYAMAQNAQDIANTAKNTADVAADAAQKAWDLAQSAQNVANDAKSIAEQALALAQANEGKITKLIEKVEALGNQIAEMNSQLTLLSENVSKALQDAADALAKATANSQEIALLKNDYDNLKAALDALANADSEINLVISAELKELQETVCCHTAELATLEVSCGLILAESIAHFEAAKCYAEKLVAAAILQMENWVKDQLKDYLLKSDVDLTLYVTKEDFNNYKQHVKDTYATKAELANYATLEELKSYVTEDTWNAFVAGLNDKLNGFDSRLNGLDAATAALSIALQNLTTEMNNKFLEQANTIATLRDRIGTLEALYNTLSEKVNNCITREEFEAYKEVVKGQINNIGNSADLSGWFSNITVQVTQDVTKELTQLLNDKLPEIKAEIIAELLAGDLAGDLADDLADILVDDFGFLTADDITGLSEALIKLTELEQKLEGIEDYADRIKALEDEILKLAQLETEVATIKSSYVTLDDLADYVKVSDLADILKDYVKFDDLTGTDLSGLATKEELQNLINTLEDYAKKTDLAGYATKDDLNNYASKDDLNNFATKDDIANFVTVGDLEAYAKKEDLALYAKLSDLDNYMKLDDFATIKQDLMDKIGANTTAINEVKDQIKDINDEITSIKDDVKDLQDRVKATEDKIDEIETKIDEIKGDVKALQDKLAKQVTGIIVQGTKNPMFGAFSIPANVQSNVLLAYYGVPKSDIEFPTYKTGSYAQNSATTLTEEDINLLKEMGLEVFEANANMPLLAENGNAGKVYMTINPNTADLDGLKLNIVNTQDKESPIKLSPIKKSTEQLQFGYTRANNGFYEADAYVTAQTVMNDNSGIAINRDDIKAIFKDVKQKIVDVAESKGDASLSDLASDVYKVVRDIRTDKNGLKCTYTDTEEHSVYSEYNLAATFLNPLNLNTAKDFNFKTMPGYEKAEGLFYKIANKAKDKVHTAFKEFNSSVLVQKISDLQIKKIEIADLTESQLALFKVSIDTTIWITGLKYHLDLNETVNVPVKFTTDVSVPVNIDQDITIDMSSVVVNTPTIAITTDIKNKNGTATLVVPVKDGDNTVGVATVDLEQIEVTADATLGTITLDGVAVAHLNYSDNVNATITVDQTVATTINIEKWIYFGDYELDADGNIVPGGTNTDAKQFHIWVTRDLSDAAESLWGTAQSALGSVNEMLDDIRKILDEFNYDLEKINNYEGKINNQIDNVVDNYLMKYLDKINTTVVDFVNSFNRRVQPFMVASTSKGFKRVSTAKEYPTLLTSDVTIYPTTKTMELIVPLARKHVAVTNAFSEDLSKSVQAGTLSKSLLTAVNTGDLNKVFDGNKRKLEVSGFQKGYVYEIAYSALDFDGNISVTKYYIKIQ